MTTKLELEQRITNLPDETIVKFEKVFNSNPDRYYKYVAFRLAGRWHTTGGEKFDSQQLVTWLLKDGGYFQNFRVVE